MAAELGADQRLGCGGHRGAVKTSSSRNSTLFTTSARRKAF